MGLISRVSSRTYRSRNIYKKEKKQMNTMLRRGMQRAVLNAHKRSVSRVPILSSDCQCMRQRSYAIQGSQNMLISRRSLFGSKTGTAPPPNAEKAAAEASAEEPVAEEVVETIEGGAEVSKLKSLLLTQEKEHEKFVKETKDKDNERLRQIADVLNTLKRNEGNHKKSMKFAKEILSVYDDLQRALDHMPKKLVEEQPEIKQLVQGIEMTKNNVEMVYSRHGIAKIEAAVGDKFDPNLHDAAFHLPAGAIPGVESDHIGAVQETGFTIHDQVLRACKVGVIQ